MFDIYLSSSWVCCWLELTLEMFHMGACFEPYEEENIFWMGSIVFSRKTMSYYAPFDTNKFEMCYLNNHFSDNFRDKLLIYKEK